jgi:hypothetical protein
MLMILSVVGAGAASAAMRHRATKAKFSNPDGPQPTRYWQGRWAASSAAKGSGLALVPMWIIALTSWYRRRSKWANVRHDKKTQEVMYLSDTLPKEWRSTFERAMFAKTCADRGYLFKTLLTRLQNLKSIDDVILSDQQFETIMDNVTFWNKEEYQRWIVNFTHEHMRATAELSRSLPHPWKEIFGLARTQRYANHVLGAFFAQNVSLPRLDSNQSAIMTNFLNFEDETRPAFSALILAHGTCPQPGTINKEIYLSKLSDLPKINMPDFGAMLGEAQRQRDNVPSAVKK